MIEDNIEDGDFVVIKPQINCENGDIIVAVHLQSSEIARTTLKRFFNEKDRDRVRLQPANSEMNPIFVPKSEWDNEWQVQGKVLAIFRKVYLKSDVISPILKAEPSNNKTSANTDKQESEYQQTISPRRLRVFLCHSSGDKDAVRQLYQRLKACNVDPWLDEENLLGGQDWEQEIRKAVGDTDVAIVCLSDASITKTGFIQKEIKFVLDVADEKPKGTIFLIPLILEPLKLEAYNVSEQIKRLHWIKYFEENGFDKLIKSLKFRCESLSEKLEAVILPKEKMS